MINAGRGAVFISMQNPIKTLAEFLKEVHVEAKKVNWPTREETTTNTILVVAFSLVVALSLGAFDYIFIHLLQRFIL